VGFKTCVLERDCNKIKSMHTLQGPVRALLLFLKGSIRYNLSSHNIVEELGSMGFGEELAVIGGAVWGENLNILSKTLLSKITLANKVGSYRLSKTQENEKRQTAHLTNRRRWQ
jgi:hypothetical protein